MKKVTFLIGFILLLALSIIKVPNASAVNQCLTINVRFTAENWVGGPIEIGCQGLKAPASKCNGDKEQIKPNNKKVTLNNCACPYNTAKNPPVFKGWADGCLYVAKELIKKPDPDRENRPGIFLKTRIDSTCSITGNKFTKISSGFYKTSKNFCGKNEEAIDVPINITCPGPTPTPTPRITLTPTPTTPQECPGPTQVTNVKVTCPTCEEGASE